MFRRILTAAAAAVSMFVCAGAPATAQAPAAPPPLEAYGKLPGLEQVILSPDGEKLAYIAVVGDARRLNVISLKGQALGAVGLGDRKVRDIQWGDNDHILITTSQTGRICTLCDKSEIYLAQSFSISRKAFVQLMANTPEAAGGFLGGPPWVRSVNGKDIVLVHGFLGPDHDYRSVQFRVDLDTGKGQLFDWNFGVMDDKGYVVAATQHFSRDGGRWRLVTGMESKGLKELYVQNDVGLDPPALLGYGKTPGTVMLRVLEEDEHRYYEINLNSGARNRFPTPPQGAEPMFDPRTDRYLGHAALKDNTWIYTFEDPEIARGWARVDKSFAGKNPRIVSWTPDHKKAVIRTDGPGETGVFILMDLIAGTASVIGEQYPAIKAPQVHETRYITYKAADGLEIPAYLTLPNGRAATGLPLVLMPHGGPHARDEPGFDWWVEALASRGYAVLRPQFRGSEGYGVSFLRAGFGEWGKKMQTDLSDGVRHLAGQGVIDPKRVCIVGASYGGYAAMAGPPLDPGVYRCAVSVSGVSDLRRMLAWEKNQTGANNSLGVRFWRRYMGAASNNDSALVAISPAQLAERFDAPILLIHGKDDLVVPYEQSEFLARALAKAGKPHEFITLQGEDHWLSRGATRLQMLSATVAFVEKHNPPA